MHTQKASNMGYGCMVQQGFLQKMYQRDTPFICIKLCIARNQVMFLNGCASFPNFVEGERDPYPRGSHGRVSIIDGQNNIYISKSCLKKKKRPPEL